MNLWLMAWRYLWQRPLISCLTIIGIALGVALISGVLTLKRETAKAFQNEAAIYDLVVGAKGSPLQLTLSTVYHLDSPTGNIDYQLYENLKNDNRISQAIPLSLGDNYKGYRIVGTTIDIFQIKHHLSTSNQQPLLTLQAGTLFEAPFQAVIGSQVAANLALDIGDQFYSSHGLLSVPGVEEHQHNPYTVVGMLQPSGTANDRAIFTTLESVWLAHNEHHDDHEHEEHNHDEHEHAEHDHAEEDQRVEVNSGGGFLFGGSQSGGNQKEITAVLLQIKMPGMRLFLAEEIKSNTNAMAAIPVNQMLRLYQQIIEPVQKSFLAVAFLVIIVASLTVVTSLYQSTERRRRDLALLRTLGAHQSEIFALVLIEAVLTVFVGIVAGWVLGHGAIQLASQYLMQNIGVVVSAWSTDILEIYALLTVFIIGTIAGLIPSLLIYRRSPLRDISQS